MPHVGNHTGGTPMPNSCLAFQAVPAGSNPDPSSQLLEETPPQALTMFTSWSSYLHLALLSPSSSMGAK